MPLDTPQQSANNPLEPGFEQPPVDLDPGDFQTAFTQSSPGQQPPIETQEPESAENPWLDRAREMGLEVEENADQDAIFNAMAERYQQLQEIQPYAEYGRSLLPHAEQINQILRQSQQPQQQPQQPEEPEWSASEYFKSQWNAPEWKEQYQVAIQNGMVERDSNGVFKAVPGYEQMVMAILPGLNEAHQFQAQKWQGLMRGNPYENFYKALHEPMQREWKQDIVAEIRRQMSRQQNMTQIQQFEQQNANWMYDQSGAPTKQGAEFLNTVRELKESGMTDPHAIIRTAQRILGNGQRQPEQPQQPQQQQTGQPETIPFPQQQAAQQQSPQQSFMQNALKRAGHSPQSGAATVNSPDAPVQMSQGDLESVFTNALRSRTGQAS